MSTLGQSERDQQGLRVMHRPSGEKVDGSDEQESDEVDCEEDVLCRSDPVFMMQDLVKRSVDVQVECWVSRWGLRSDNGQKLVFRDLMA